MGTFDTTERFWRSHWLRSSLTSSIALLCGIHYSPMASIGDFLCRGKPANGCIQNNPVLTPIPVKHYHPTSTRFALRRFPASCRRQKEMVLGVVSTFKDHRSLAHTLQDSEHIARKLGLIIMAVILFILFVSVIRSVSALTYEGVHPHVDR